MMVSGFRGSPTTVLSLRIWTGVSSVNRYILMLGSLKLARRQIVFIAVDKSCSEDQSRLSVSSRLSDLVALAT
jgi:hypothetical protein